MKLLQFFLVTISSSLWLREAKGIKKLPPETRTLSCSSTCITKDCVQGSTNCAWVYYTMMLKEANVAQLQWNKFQVVPMQIHTSPRKDWT